MTESKHLATAARSKLAPERRAAAGASDSGDERLAEGGAIPAPPTPARPKYVVIAAGGGKMGTKSGDAYVAFALPD